MTLAQRPRAIAALFVLVLAVIGSLGWYLEHAHRTQRAALLEGFVERAELTARLTAAALDSTSEEVVAELEAEFGGPAAGLQHRLVDYDRKYGLPAGAILDARGRILAADPPGWRLDGATGMRAIDRLPSERGHNRFGDLPGAGSKMAGVVMVATTIKGSDGLRVSVAPAPKGQIATFANSYLESAPAVNGARAFLVDGRGRMLAGDGTEGARPRGFTGDWQVARAGVRGTRWTVVFGAPKRALFAPVEGPTRTLTITLFFALAIALVLALALALRVIRRTADVAEARGAEAAARESERSARELAHERLHDPLTGLPNRSLFLDRAERAISSIPRSQRTLAVMFIDLDRFKRVNDSLGHEAGDELLGAIAKRLAHEVRGGDTVSRFGGDEFVVLCDGTDETNVMRLCQRLHAAVEAPLHVRGRELKVTASIGVSLLRPADVPRDADSLIRDADIAMYRAKRQGRGASAVFNEELNRSALERLDTEVALSRALERDELVLHYQPMVEPAGARIVGMEALVRWQHPERGFVGPHEFIPVAEESGLIVEIGEWVLRQACQELAGLRRRGEVADDVHVSVNLSPVQLMSDGLADAVASALRDSGLPPDSLWLEVTENAVMSDVEQGVSMLQRLKGLGVRLAMDDFGTGHSSLSHVARLLPIDVLKLDRSFVMAMENRREYAIVSAVAALGHDLGLVTVAEGVETPAAAAAVAKLGYDIGQGFLWHRPEPIEAMRPILLGQLHAAALPKAA